MISPSFFFDQLIQNEIHFFTGVPDSLLKNICAYITDQVDEKKHIIAANEGGSLSLGLGYHLATGNIPLIYMQNSGLGNIVNPLLSLADPDVYSIPLLLLIGWRGEPNVKDEPQHKKQGRITEELLKTMEIPYLILSQDDDEETVKKKVAQAAHDCKKYQFPYAFLVKKNTFHSYLLKKDKYFEATLSREQALEILMPYIEKKEIIVSTTGVTSRELFEYRERKKQNHSKDFLTVGGMGHANQIALGIALEKPDKNVFCLDGDGAILMHLGSLGIIGNFNLKNLKHIVFNNAAHDSVGGQPTIADSIDIKKMALSLGYKQVFQARTESEIKQTMVEMQLIKDCCLLEIQVKKGFRSNLGRPTTTPKMNKEQFIKFIKQG